MIQIKDEGTLMCNRVGHNNNPIQAVCIRQGCGQPIPCCVKCMMQEHKNHDYVDIPDIRNSINLSLNFLNQLSQLSESIFEVCQSWRKQIQKLIDQAKQFLQLPEHPTLNQLSDSVQYFRDSVSQLKQEELIQDYTKQQNSLKMNLEQLKNHIKNLLEYQQSGIIQQNQVQKKIVIQESQIIQQNDIKKNNLNLKNIKFSLACQLKGHDKQVLYVAISNDDKYLASSQSDPSKVILWDVKSNKLIIQYTPQFKYVHALQFSNDNNMLAVGSTTYEEEESVIEIFDIINLNSNQAKIRLEGHTDIIARIIFTDDSKKLISVSSDMSLRVWDLNAKKEINKQNCDNNLYGVAYSSQQKLIAYCGYGGYANLFDSRTLNNSILKVKWQAHIGYCCCIEFIKNSTVIMTSSYTETRFWQVNDVLNKNFKHFKEIQNGGCTIKAYPIDSPQVIINCSSDCKYVNLWNYDSTELIQSIEIPGGLCYTFFAITSDFKKIITGGKNKMVQVFEKKSGI